MNQIRTLSFCFLIVLVLLISAPVYAQDAEFDALAQKLAALGITPTRIEGSAAAQVLVAYEQHFGEGDGAVLFNALAVMRTVVETLPQVQQVVVSSSYAGQPLVEITAQSADVRAMHANQLDIDTFYDRLSFNEQRPPDLALLRNMGLLNIWEHGLTLQGNELHLSFAQPLVEPPDSLAVEWVQIFEWIADKTAGLTGATLHTSLPDGTQIVVRVDLANVLAYRSGAMSFAELLASLEIAAVPGVALAEISPTVTMQFLAAPASTTPAELTVAPAAQPTQPVIPTLPQGQPPPILNIPTLPPPPLQLSGGPPTLAPEVGAPLSELAAPTPSQLESPPLVLVQPTLSPPQVEPGATQLVLQPELPEAPPPTQQPPVLPQQTVGAGRIAFASNFQGDYEIYTIDPDGSNLVRLTNRPGEDWLPAWSPDGSQIAYQYMCAEHGVFHLCFMNADGSDVRCLKPTIQGNPVSVQRPAWSPDGRSFVFSAESMSQPTTVNIISADGSTLTTLSTGRDPSWSPAGSRITFMDNGQVFVINADGSGKQQLTNNPGYCMYPTWSPDGTRIAYSVDGQGLHIMNADGSGDQIVAPNTSWGLAWSPDGSQLALGAENMVTILGSDGSFVRNVMQGVQPSWGRAGGVAAPSLPETSAVEEPPAQVPAQAVSAASGLSGYIAYPVFKPAMSKPTYDIYVSKPDGTERQLLWEWGRQPDVRRGDRRVVLNGDGQGKDNLWTVNIDGSDPREASLHPEDAHPRWGPYGDRLLFDSEFYLWNDQRQWTVWVQNSVDKGSEPIAVTVADRVVPGKSPLWLDNDWVVYNGCNFWEGGSRCGLYTNPSWGDARARMLTDQADDTAGDCFGERIAYMSRASGNWDVWTVNFDGGGKMNLSNHPANDGLPAFSPDGSKIAFLSDRAGAWAVWMMNADGTNPQQLFDTGGTMGDDWATERISWE